MNNGDTKKPTLSDEDGFDARVNAALETIVAPSPRDLLAFVKQRGAWLRKLHDAGMSWEEIAGFASNEIGREVKPGTVSQYMSREFPGRNRAWQPKKNQGEISTPTAESAAPAARKISETHVSSLKL